MIEEKDVLIRVRDGIQMAARIYRPDGAGPFPALFATSPYRYDNNTLPAQPMFLWRETGPIEWYVDNGYAYVHADVRGTGRSEGEFEFLGRWEQHDENTFVPHDVFNRKRRESCPPERRAASTKPSTKGSTVL